MRRLFFSLLVAITMTTATSGDAVALDPENTLYLELETGRVVIEMRPDVAPKHVARIKELVRDGFYDGLIFHRVIGGFMAQGGDPDGRGTGGTGQKLPAEFSGIPFKRGTVGMARSASPDSGDSQFFIMFARQPHLDNQYTVWGQVTEGMVHVGKLKRGEPPVSPSKILSAKIAADVK